MARRGATLVEVLVAIFVMGIGMIALLALFPVGALRMAQAIQDGRAANVAQTADSLATVFNIRTDGNVVNAYSNPGGTLNPPNPFMPSYPVLVDPAGYSTASGTGNQNWVAGIQNTIPRTTLSYVASAAQALQWFGFLDDIQFGTAGYPQTQSGSMISPYPFYRELRYSLAYLCQKPKSSENMSNIATIIFSRRSLSLGGNLTLPEYVYDGTRTLPGNNTNNTQFDTARNVVTVDYSNYGVAPPVRIGEWLLDVTPITAAQVNVPPNPAYGPFGSAHGYFYRVVSITDNGNSTIDYEVQTPIRGFVPGTPGQAGRVIVLEGVAEVIERSSGRKQQ